MNKEKFCLASDVIEISEEDKSYLEMVNRVCYYGAPNANGVILPAETAEQFASTLVDMQVYAKCRVNENGEPTFGSHEVCLDENGELFFDTTPIGVHTSVEVKEDTVTDGGVQQTLPCLFATQKIWTRNTNAVAAIKRLFAEGKLHNSWELYNNAYTFSDGLKTITDYEFIGNTMLGYEYADPAYGESAKVLSISEAELMVAEALSRDLIAQKEEGENLNQEMNNPEIVEQTTVSTEPVSETNSVPANEQQVEDNPVTVSEDPVTNDPETDPKSDPETQLDAEPTVPESSSLTAWDIHDKIRDAAMKLLDKWCWVSFVFPEEHYALLDTDDISDELTFIKVSYSVLEDDTVSVFDPVEIKLVVSISEINDKIAELNETIVSLNSELEKANAEINLLTPYREAAEKAEHDQKVAELRSYVENSKQFSVDELESDEISALIEQCNESAIKAMIADRVVSAQKKASSPKNVPNVVNASIADGENQPLDYLAVMRDFLAHNHD